MAALVSGPAGLDWTVYAGDRNEEPFELLAGDVPWDITGCELLVQARVRASDPAVVLTATVVVTDAMLGLVTVGWDGEAVRAALDGAESVTWVWDWQILEPGQTLPVTLLRGRLTGQMDVSREVVLA